MTPYALDLWRRAQDALRVAGHLLPVSPDAAASRAYYAAFYAVSALFAAEGVEFRKHAAVETAVHRDLVRPGRWTASLGMDYSAILDLREKGDYGGSEHVESDEAREAVAAARRIVEAVLAACPGLPPSENTTEK